MEKSLLVAGFGGQGVMLIGKTIGYAASKADKFVTFSPAYGSEQRGGTANCTVVISDKEIASPIKGMIDDLIIMNELSYERFSSKVKKGGTMVINSSMVLSKCDNKEINVYYVPVNDIAAELGNPLVANIVMLGAYIGISNILDKEVVLDIVKYNLKDKPKLIDINVNAFNKGIESVK
ncbi:MAG: pyruvate ferredoxin oxidoreductase [Eubacteriaceae bacterium]|nr:pyruvate ferredoxin oxidoreductase [Eubacteriaceae bacterium]